MRLLQEIKSRKMVQTPLFLFPFASVLPDIKMTLNILNFFEYWDQVLYGLMGVILFFIVVLSAKDLLFIYRKTKDEKSLTLSVGLRRILTRALSGAMVCLILYRFGDLYRLYTFFDSMVIVFIWLCIAALSVWQLSKRKKIGLWLTLILHVIAALVLIMGFIYDHPDYSIGIGYLAALIILVNSTILFREKISKWLSTGKTFWLVVIIFFSVLFSPILKSPAVLFSEKLPKFGAISILPGTQGMEITDIAVSETGNTIYFLTLDKTKGLGRIQLPSTEPVYTKNGMTEFSALTRLPYEGGNVLAAAAVERNRPQIELYVMEPFATIGRYNFPAGSLTGARVHKMVAGDQRFYVTVLSDAGNFQVVCVPVAARHINLEKFHAGCAQVRIETKNPGELAASDYVNRIMIGQKVPPFGINISVEEWIAKIMKKRRDLKFDFGATTFIYGDDDYHVYFGQPFSYGMLETDADNFKPLRYHPGPKAVSKIYRKGDLLIGGSYLEGKVAIHNLKFQKYKNVVVGPKVRDFDYNKEQSILYVATSVGIVKVDFSMIRWDLTGG